jgi:hypothetical protein
MKTRWKILIAAGIFLALMAATLLLNGHYQPSSAVEAYKKSLRERGEKLELSEVLPPPVPAESNSVAAVEDAFGMLVPGDTKLLYAMKMVAPGKALVGWQQPEVRGSDFTNSWEDFSNYNAANRPALELLHQVFDKPQLDFNLDYKKGAALLLPHLSKLKRSTQILESAAIGDLHTGNPGAAATNILTTLGLVRRNVAEGIMISQLVRLAMTGIAITPTWELLQATNVTEAQLAAVQAGWEQMDFLGDATNAFVMERAWGINEIKKFRAMSHEDFQKMTASYSSLSSGGSAGSSVSVWDWETLTEKSRNAIGTLMWQSSWSYADELRAVKGGTIVLDTLRLMQTNQSQFYKADLDAMQSQLAALGITNVGAAFFAALKIPNAGVIFSGWDMSRPVQKILRTETARRVVVTAIALKRFELRHNKFPETLGELAPEFFASVPIDPYDGKSLRYRANGDGTFLLYAVGEDGTDDGGDPSVPPPHTSPFFSWQNEHARDWVWPQPATALEIQTYYEDEAKKAK